jgi:urea transporter
MPAGTLILYPPCLYKTNPCNLQLCVALTTLSSVAATLLRVQYSSIYGGFYGYTGTLCTLCRQQFCVGLTTVCSVAATMHITVLYVWAAMATCAEPSKPCNHPTISWYMLHIGKFASRRLQTYSYWYWL